MTNGVHPLAGIIAAFARGVSGVQLRWSDGFTETTRQRIYFANHASHLDFVVLWAALPAAVRERTRPVAAKDYWEKGARGYLAQRVFRAVLVQRGGAAQAATEEEARAAGRAVVEQLAMAMGEMESLILFPEGTRGTGENIAPFRSGLYHLARRKLEAELLPVYLENMNRILPKGELLPVPLISSLTFGTPIQVHAGESKDAFLERARAALCGLRRGGSP